MPSSSQAAIQMQRRYYTGTAAKYECMHAQESADDPMIRKLILSVLRMIDVNSLLDVGSATGRGLQDLAVSLLRGSGEAHPFADGSFDVVSELSMLHHVANPGAIIKEMLGVARRAAVIAGCNRFGQGSFPARLFKLFLYKMHLWNTFNFLRTRGKHYQVSEGDGLFYSYSVYDSYDLLMSWADRILALPTSPTHERGWLHPLLTSSGVMLVANTRTAGSQKINQ